MSRVAALSDEEVISKPQKGYLYHFKVEVIENRAPSGNRDDPARDHHGRHSGGRESARLALPAADRKTARRPLPVENQAALPIIADEAVDFEFGTGVLKVTPAHDKADYTKSACGTTSRLSISLIQTEALTSLRERISPALTASKRASRRLRNCASWAPS